MLGWEPLVGSILISQDTRPCRGPPCPEGFLCQPQDWQVGNVSHSPPGWSQSPRAWEGSFQVWGAGRRPVGLPGAPGLVPAQGPSA